MMPPNHAIPARVSLRPRPLARVLGGETLVQPARRVVGRPRREREVTELVPQASQRIDVVAGLAERDRETPRFRITATPIA